MGATEMNRSFSMSNFVEIDGVFINKIRVSAVSKYMGSGYDSNEATCIFFSGNEDDHFVVELPIEKVMELLNE